MNIIVCDLDNTLCNDNHRGSLAPINRTIKNEQDAWLEYHMACDLDEPYPDILGYLNVHGPLSKVIFSTGRDYRARSLTRQWLKQNVKCKYEAILMRPQGMTESASVFKVRMAIEFIESKLLRGESIKTVKKNILVIDDDRRLIANWKKVGVKTWHIKRKVGDVPNRY